MVLKHRAGTGRPVPAGLAAVELAGLLPVLCFIALVATDFGRAFYAWVTVADCARNGALYAAGYAPYPGIPSSIALARTATMMVAPP